MDLLVLSDEETDFVMPGESPTFFAEDTFDEERNPLKELFPNICLSPSLPPNYLDEYYTDSLKFVFEFQPNASEINLESSTLRNMKIEVPEVPRQEPKKRGRPRKNKIGVRAAAAVAEPIIRKYVPSVELTTERKKKKRKCMTQIEKAQHNHLERERRKGVTILLESLRCLVPSVKDDMKASQKKIVDEAAAFIKAEKPIFLSYLKEREIFLSLEKKKRQLEKELARKRGILFVWEERRGMSARDLYKKVKREAKEDLRDEETDEAIHLLESYCYRSPADSPSFSESSIDSDEEQLNVEV